MKRRLAIEACLCSLLGWRAASGQPRPASRPARVAWLSGSVRTAYEKMLFERLHELGWTEGVNLELHFRYANGRAEPLAALAAELVALEPDVIVAPGTTAARAARDATSRIAIVMAGVGDPVGGGLIKSLARPGGNLTGVSLRGEEIIPKALSLLHEVVPRARRIDLMGNAANPSNPFFTKVLSAAGRSRGLDCRMIELRRPDDVLPAIAEASVDALLALPDPMFYPLFGRMAQAAIARRLPLADAVGRLVTAQGTLLSYAVSQNEVYRLSAQFVDRILRGAKPAEIPVEQPTRYELAVNLRTSRAIGVTFPQSVLLRADEVIE